MSAIVAKAINDSLGTKNFKGLNTIMDEQLEKFVDSIEKLPESIEGSIRSLSLPFYVPSTPNPIEYRENEIVHDVIPAGYVYAPNSKIGKTYTFKGSGRIAINYNLRNSESYIQYEKNGVKKRLHREEGDEDLRVVVDISPNDVLSFYSGSSSENDINKLTLSFRVVQNAGIISN